MTFKNLHCQILKQSSRCVIYSRILYQELWKQQVRDPRILISRVARFEDLHQCFDVTVMNISILLITGTLLCRFFYTTAVFQFWIPTFSLGLRCITFLLHLPFSTSSLTASLYLRLLTDSDLRTFSQHPRFPT